jgi:hypothetical protein
MNQTEIMKEWRQFVMGRDSEQEAWLREWALDCLELWGEKESDDVDD